MYRSLRWSIALIVLAMIPVSRATAHGPGRPPQPQGDHQGDDDDQGDSQPVLKATLKGLAEVPAVISDGHGRFQATLNQAGDELTYSLSYTDLEGAAQQAHIHVGQRFAAGGIAVFLCTNLGNGPAGTQACPNAPGAITGTIKAADVIGPATQGVGAGDFTDLLRAIRVGDAYVNVHTDVAPGGEIRGQLRVDDNGHQ